MRCWHASPAGSSMRYAASTALCTTSPQSLRGPSSGSDGEQQRSTEVYAHDAGDDQVGALHLRAAVCAVRGAARGEWYSEWARALLDRGVHGVGAYCSDGVQPARGCRVRWREPTDEDAGITCRSVEPALRRRVHAHLSSHLRVLGSAVEPVHDVAFACRAADTAGLQILNNNV